MSSFPVLRPLLCAALLCAGGPALPAAAVAPAAATAPSGAVPAVPVPSASAPGVGLSVPGATATPGAAPPEMPRLEIGVPDLRQRIGERLAAMRAARAAGHRSVAASAVEPAERRPASYAAVAAPRLAALGPAGDAPARRPGSRPAAAAVPPTHGERSWSYDGDTGPEAWAALRPEYATCAAGRRQSPIDVRDGISVDLEPLRFDYQPGAFSVLDSGHTVQVDVAPGNALSVGGRRYELKQFHFHRPSEERLEGRGYEMDVHLVHADAEGRLAVVAVLVEGGKAHPLVQQVWNNLPLEPRQPEAAPGPIDPGALLPEDRRYATYMGSLTTPPCTEGVLWIVLKQPATMSPEQIAIFARLYPGNARPLQSAGGRLIKQSN
jgi:carbonic anhydrase